MESKSTVIIHELGQLESRELQQLLGSQAATRESHALSHTQHGNAAVVDLIVQATPWVVGVVGLWLLKPRKGKTFHKKLTSKDESGTLHEENIYIHEYVEESPSESVVEALSKLFSLSGEAVKKAIADAVTTRDTK